MGIRPGQARGPWVGHTGGGSGDAETTFEITPSMLVPHTEGGCGLRVTISPPGTEPRCCYESARYSPTLGGQTLDSARFDTPITLYPSAPIPTQTRVQLFVTQIDTALGGDDIDFRFWNAWVNDTGSLDTEHSLHFVNFTTPAQWCLKIVTSNWQNIYNTGAGVIADTSILMLRLRRLGQFDTFSGDLHLLKVRLQVR